MFDANEKTPEMVDFAAEQLARFTNVYPCNYGDLVLNCECDECPENNVDCWKMAIMGEWF